ncbi:MAG TPA: hypothetical protein DEH78_13950 [Solibacterales bacterium]|nr:hypothetical protein [Bryobacterales bacterium]
MKKPAKIYIASIATLGIGVLASQWPEWHPDSFARLSLYAVVTIFGSAMKIRLPGITGTMSIYFLFLLVGLTQFSQPELLLVGIGAVLIQCFCFAKKRPTIVQILFNVGSNSMAIHCAHRVYHWNLLTGPDLGVPVQIAAASLAFFVLNTGLVAAVVALTEGKPVHRIWRECYFWCFPYYLLGAAVAGGFHYISSAIGWQAALLLLPVFYVVYGSYRLYLDKLEGEKEHVQQVAALHLRTIEALALAIDAKDRSTHEHLERVQLYAMELGRELGLTGDQLSALEAASLLHDIGKLAVPEHIISKPGRLTPEEFEKMKIHPIIGAEIIETVQFPYPVAPIVLAHHEKWNGTGYPHGLRGDQIPVGARILSVVDCMDALASERPYRRAIPLDEAVKFIESEAGKSYDPKIVALLKAGYTRYEAKLRSAAQAGAKAVLSHDLKVEKGEAPDAGFESSDGDRPRMREGAPDFLTCIAGARHEAQMLFELVQSLGDSLSLQDTLSMMAGRLGKLIEYDALAVYLRKDGVLQPEYVIGVDARFLGSLSIPEGHGLSGWVAERKAPILNGAASVEAGYLNNDKMFCSLNSALAVPLLRQEEVVGVLTLYSLRRDAFSLDQQRVLQAIAAKLTMSIENARRFEQAESSATVDYLTGLPNARSLFLRLDEEIHRCRRGRQTLAVMVCDLNNFKLVNDRFGHVAGNRVLQGIAAQIPARLRRSDYVARMGGDEFVVLLPGLPAEALPARIAELDQTVIAVCREVCGEDVVSLSCGVAFLEQDAALAEDLLTIADRRMYQYKAESRRSRSLRNLARSSEPFDCLERAS